MKISSFSAPTSGRVRSSAGPNPEPQETPPEALTLADRIGLPIVVSLPVVGGFLQGLAAGNIGSHGNDSAAERLFLGMVSNWAGSALLFSNGNSPLGYVGAGLCALPGLGFAMFLSRQRQNAEH